jgi:cytoskeleton protein RodZ
MAKVTRLTLDSSGGLERRRLHLHEIAEADAPLETVGQDLRKARQRKGEDLAQVSAALKIRKDHLDAIEESEIGLLPGRAYAIGFVRTYAEYLGLDAAQCVERLKAEIAGRTENKEGTVQISPPRERTLPQGGLIFAAVLLIALAYGGYYLVVTASRTPSQALTPVPDRLAAQAGLQPAPEEPAFASSRSEPAPLPVQTVPPLPIPAPAPGQNALAPAVPLPGPALDNGPLPQGQKYGARNANSHVTLRMHREGRVDITGPNNRVFIGRVLKPGDTYQVPNVPGVILTTPDAGAVEMILDGSSIGFAGQNGVAASGLSLDPQDIADRRGNAG